MIKPTKAVNILLLLIAFIMLPGAKGYAQSSESARIVLLETMPVPVVLEHSKWFISELEALGYQVGKNLDLVLLQANGDKSRAIHLLKETVEKKRPDVVVTNATLATQAAVQVLNGTRIPVVFMTVSDPVGAGIIQKIGDPTKTNITGRVHMIERETRINLVMRLIGNSSEKPVRVGFIHSSYPSAVGDIKGLQSAAAYRNDIVFVPFQILYKKVPEGLPEMLREVAKGIERLDDKIDFWWEPSGPLGELPEYTQLLLEKSEKPIIMGTTDHAVRLGALLHLTPSIEGSGREVARIADSIIKGHDPGKIPPRPPADFDMGVNLTTAVKHGIVIPPDLLKLAGENCYH